MGYTHYWRRVQKFDPIKFAAAVEDFNRLVPFMERIGVNLAGWDGSGNPKIDAHEISFNGVEKCGHESFDLGITWPSKRAGGVAGHGDKPIDGDWFAGAQLESRSCGGDCSHESFSIPLVFEPEPYNKTTDDGLFFNFCKTAFKPYDLAVTAALVVLKKHLGDSIRISSDGEDCHWFDAKMVCQQELGYGMDFNLDNGE